MFVNEKRYLDNLTKNKKGKQEKTPGEESARKR